MDDQPKNPVANNLDGDPMTDDQPKNPFHRAECGGNGFKQVKLWSLAATPLSGDPKSQDYSHPVECSYTNCCLRLCVMGTKETTV